MEDKKERLDKRFYWIPINRSTFKTNPLAGQTRTFISRPEEVDGTAYILIPVEWEYSQQSNFINELKGRFSDVEIHAESIATEVRVGLKSENDVIAIRGISPNCRFSLTRGVDSFLHPPLPRYIFEYENIKVTCGRCFRQFSHKELYSDSIIVDGGESLLQNICPFCHTPECCDIEYEASGKVARELGLRGE